MKDYIWIALALSLVAFVLFQPRDRGCPDGKCCPDSCCPKDR